MRKKSAKSTKTKKMAKGHEIGDLQAFFEGAHTPEEFEALAATLRKPPKVLIRLSLDADVLAWFRGGGPGYQTRINRALRRVMEEQKEKGGV